MLTRAFWDYPVSSYSYPDEEARKRRLPYFFQYVLRYCLKYGEIHVTSSNLEGIAAWLPSQNFPITIWKTLRSVPLSVLFNMGQESGRQMKAYADYIDNVHKRLAPFPHRFLQVIGVDPAYQGRGYASRLLLPALARAGRDGLPCYLETLDEKDVAIYRHFGFEVIEQSRVPRTNLTNWAMLREPPR